jgi:hypothetical protein
MKSRPELEKDIESRIRSALADAGVVAWKHNVDNRQLHTGLGVGTADLICIVPPSGRFLAIEVKSMRKGSKPNADQIRWLEVVRKHGGVAGVARSVEEAMALVEKARQPV